MVRYHSLAVEEASLPACIHPIAWTCGSHHALERAEQSVSQPSAAAAAGEQSIDGGEPDAPGDGPSIQPGQSSVLMAIKHADRPHYGVQFHPESIATKFGATLLRNFRLLADSHHGRFTLPAPAFSPGATRAHLFRALHDAHRAKRCLRWIAGCIALHLI